MTTIQYFLFKQIRFKLQFCITFQVGHVCLFSRRKQLLINDNILA